MQISNNIKSDNLSIIIENNLIISDIHLGYEDEMREKGLLMPKRDINKIISNIELLIKKNKIKTLIINGDLKHVFGKISKSEMYDTLKLIDILSEKVKIIFIKGNHDTILEPIAKKRDIKMINYLVINRILITHGHKEIKTKKEYNSIIIGHQHPSITIKHGVRSERYKCFLKSRFKRKNLIVMPSFSDIYEGSDTLSYGTVSPYIKESKMKDFEVFIPTEDKVLYFGKVRDIKKFSQ